MKKTRVIQDTSPSWGGTQFELVVVSMRLGSTTLNHSRPNNNSFPALESASFRFVYERYGNLSTQNAKALVNIADNLTQLIIQVGTIASRSC